ncbi:MAG: hypothetical protein M1546_01080 [Chloroflexi bacterium]|nr:hypothetical protein [Chloroflexota bacterium]
MSRKMTNRQRVLAVLNGERPDKVPFTIYDWKIPWGYDKRKLCERGLVMMERYAGCRAEYPHCEFTMLTYTENGRKYEREIIKTPKGEISSLFMPGTTCNVRKQIEYWIRSEADYEPLIYWVNDTTYYPAYEEVEAAREALGEDGFVWLWTDYSPLQKIMLQLIGLERYPYELFDHADLLWALYDALRDRDRRKYPIVAKAPVEVIQSDANHIACYLGRDMFVNKVLPCVEEAAEVLHTEGKLQSIHVDGNNAIWAADLARSSVDIIEAFTPAPDTDMTMAEAREIFRDKIMWTNFPSSLHLQPAERIREAAREILESIQSGDRFLMAVTEDVPPWSWRTSLNAIQDAIDICGTFR